VKDDDADIDVDRLAEVAHLELSEEEKASFRRQLGEMLRHMRRLAAPDLAEAEPTTRGGTAGQALRDDVVTPGLDRETALANAPERLGDEFKVPRIVE
jgi:aspartyl-tRNA(Asn)/glutamyl-tRNA(Gln) amidotransferase subunit C